MKTREKILAAALELFNERGDANVSLAQIARRVGISEGNLWYHFRTKRALIGALLAELDERMGETLSRPPTGGQLRDFAAYATESFRRIWEYRFLYQHRFDRRKEPELAGRRADYMERCLRKNERLVAEMVRRNVLRASPRQVPMIATTATILSRYWLDYVQERNRVGTITEADIEAGVEQIFALYRPYLTEKAYAEAKAEAAAKERKELPKTA